MTLESVDKKKGNDLRISTFIPPFFRCPISLEVMRDPVSLCTGVTYDRPNIEKWLDEGNNVCPATMETLQNHDMVPNHTLRRLIQGWCVSKGIDRIPTPKSPADPTRVRQMMDDIINKTNNTSAALRNLRILARAGERNRNCMKSVGVLQVLAQALCADRHSILGSQDEDLGKPKLDILEETVAVIVCFSLDDETRRLLRRPQLLGSLELLLRRGSMEARTNAAILIENLSLDRAFAREIGSNEGMIESLVGLVGEDIDEMYSEAVSASLNALFNLCSVVGNRLKISEADAVPALIDIVNGDDNGLSERSLGILDALSTTAEGRAAIDEHTIALPAIVRSLLVVSNAANEYAVGIIWRICFKSGEDDVLNEGLLVGAFKKLLVLVQIDSSSPTTKVKAKQLLKLFSPMRHSH